MRSLLVAYLLFAAHAFAAEPVIVIDPGHGGIKEGATGVDGTREKKFTLDVAVKLKEELKAKGYKVLMTRHSDEDVPLASRVDVANKSNPDVFVSIHANSMPTLRQRKMVEGVETYFLALKASGEQARRVAARENAELGEKSDKSKNTLGMILDDLQRSTAHQGASRLAYLIHDAIVAATGAQNRGVQQAPFYVLSGLDAPAVLVEVGYISHPTEGLKLVELAYQQSVAKAIAQGIEKYLKPHSQK